MNARVFCKHHQIHHKLCCPISKWMTLAIWFFNESKRFVKHHWNCSWESDSYSQWIIRSRRWIHNWLPHWTHWVTFQLGLFCNVHQTQYEPCCQTGEWMTLMNQFFIISQWKRPVKHHWSCSWETGLNKTHSGSESFRSINEFINDSLTEP